MITRSNLLRVALQSTSPSIIYKHFDASGVHHITLSREKALNSLDADMVNALAPIYKAIHADASNTGAVLLKGAGSKAFCAGGDVVSMVKDPNVRKHFFYTEYQVNYSIMTLPVPHVAFLDGIVMGGGVGVSVHGSHRLTSEKATFAMPETAIGLFPDVGGTWFLPRVKPDGLGLFLALTGCRLKGADLVHAGVGTHYVPSELMPKVEEALCNESSLRTAPVESKKQLVSNIVDGIVGDKKNGPEFSLAQHLPQIQKCFGSHVTSVEDVLAKLQEDGSEWALKQHKALLGFSPTSLKLSFALFRAGAKLTSQEEMFKLEYRASQHCMEENDFHAGVSALLIDKTGKPTWKPADLASVSDQLVQKYFGPTSHGIEWDAQKPFPQ